MDSQIEVVGKETPELYTQLYNKVIGFLRVPTTTVFGILILLAWLENDDVITQIVMTFGYGVAMLVFLCYPTWVAKIAYKNKLKYYDGEMPQTRACFGEQILLEDVDTRKIIPYEKIEKVYFMHHGIAIRLNAHTTIGLPNQEFTKGSLSELKQLLREKRPDLKIPE